MLAVLGAVLPPLISTRSNAEQLLLEMADAMRLMASVVSKLSADEKNGRRKLLSYGVFGQAGRQAALRTSNRKRF